MPKYNARRDNNESELKPIWEKLGWRLWKLTEYADWLGLRNGRWHLVEIKRPDKEGWDSEYTPQQKIFHTDVKACGGKVLIWRTQDDIVRDSNARVGA